MKDVLTLVRQRDALPREERGTADVGWLEVNGFRYEDQSAWTGRTSRYQAAQDAVSRASFELDNARQSYFHFSMSGMSAACRIMWSVGMLIDDGPGEPCPEARACGITEDQAYAVKYSDEEGYLAAFQSMTPGQREQASRYWEEVERWLSRHDRADTPGIPERKFSTNDGWIVLPAECEAAARIWDAWLADNGEPAAMVDVMLELGSNSYGYWLRWVEWIRAAARHGGFEVH